MVLAIMTALVRRPAWAKTRSPALSRSPFCAVLRAERKRGNEDLGRARLGLVFCGCSRWAWRL
eukprot:7730901-Alexandrium_andersonii.AAC.1